MAITSKPLLKETGFGTKGFENSDRLINTDGSFNVIKKGGGVEGFSLYQWLINLSWFQFFLFVLSSYILLNSLFGVIYYLIGYDEISSAPVTTEFQKLLNCFYFSTHTLTTVGFGHISPKGNSISFLASFEAMIGLLGFAFATGLMYGRFSKAKAKILFSKNILISPYKAITGLMFRIVNLRKNQLIEMNAKVIYSRTVIEDGNIKRQYSQLELEIDFITMFPLPWTIVHPIETSSLISGKSIVDFEKEKAEFIVILKGYDDTFNQYVHQIHSYKPFEIIDNAKLIPMFDPGYEKSPIVFLNKISEFLKL